MKNGGTRRSRPQVSVIVPAFNRAHTLPRAIRSILAQTWEDLELIVADDGSTDGTRELVESLPDARLRYFRNETNRGAAAARNLGLAHAQGDFIAFQDSDDEWLLDKLEFQLETLRVPGEEYGATFGGKLIYGRDPAGRFGDGLSDYRPHKAHRVVSGDLTAQLLEQNLISPQTLLMRTHVARDTGLFDERLPNNEDWEFMLRLSQRTRILFTNRPVVVAYISGDSISRNLRSNARSFMAVLKKHEALFRAHPRIHGGKLFALGRYLQRLGRPAAARKFLWRAVRQDPWSARGWARLSETWLHGARITCQRALQRAGALAPSPAGRERHVQIDAD